jgi:hypothetical protein
LLERELKFERCDCKKSGYVTEVNKQRKILVEMQNALEDTDKQQVQNIQKKIAMLPDHMEIKYCKQLIPCECRECTLSAQPDFKGQLSAIAEFFVVYNSVNGTYHICIFLPKFHPELNFIERCWSKVKAYVRDRCNGTIAQLRISVGETGNPGPAFSLENLPLAEIRRYSRTAWHYCVAYSKGLDLVEANYAMKKYRRHRNFVKKCDMEINDYFLAFPEAN